MLDIIKDYFSNIFNEALLNKIFSLTWRVLISLAILIITVRLVKLFKKFLRKAFKNLKLDDGIAGFLVSLIGSAIVKTVQANSNMVFGAHIYAQQILASIAFLLAFAAVIYTQTIIKTLPRYNESTNIRP